MIKIAVCDDKLDICQSVKEVIERHLQDAEVDAFTTGRDVYESAVKKRYDIILMDIELDPDGGETGMDNSHRLFWQG